MSTVVSLICLGPSFQKMTGHFLLHGSLWPTNLEKNLKPWTCKLGRDIGVAWVAAYTGTIFLVGKHDFMNRPKLNLLLN